MLLDIAVAALLSNDPSNSVTAVKAAGTTRYCTSSVTASYAVPAVVALCGGASTG